MKIESLISIISTLNKEVKVKDVLINGKYPVISQSKDNIDGYFNDETKLIIDLPIILFGDHTRIVKYISSPFIPGADGTKLFKAKCYPKYLFYLIKYASSLIENRGYGRHFSYLKNCEVPYFSNINKQIEIVVYLDYYFKCIDNLLYQYNKINTLKDSIKSKVLGLIFSENSSYKSYYENKKLSEVSKITMGQSPKGEDITNNANKGGLEFHQGKLDFGELVINDSHKYAIKYNKIAEPGSILFSVRAPVGSINFTDRKIAIGRGLCSILPYDNMVDKKFLYYQLLYLKNYFIEKGTGSTFQAITVDVLINSIILICNIEMQKIIVEKIDKIFKLIDNM